MKTKQSFLAIVLSVFVLSLSSGCQVVVDREAGLASTQFRGTEIFRSGYTSQSGVWVFNRYPDYGLVVTIRIISVIELYPRPGTPYQGYRQREFVRTVSAKRTYQSGPGEKLWVPSPGIVIDSSGNSREHVEVSYDFVGRDGRRTAGDTRSFYPGGQEFWGYEMNVQM